MRKSTVVGLVGCLLLAAKSGGAYTVPTHQQLVDASIQQLFSDTAKALWAGDLDNAIWRYRAAEFWSSYKGDLKQGVGDVDLRPWLFSPASWSIHHGWNPTTNAGWFGAIGANEFANSYEGEAISSFYRGDRARAALYTGATLHFVQDLTVPHHTACRIGDSHYDYEHDCDRFGSSIRTNTPGIYAFSGFTEEELVNAPASIWVEYAGSQSEPAYALVGANDKLAKQSFEPVGIVQMHLASRLGAGYLYWLYRYLHR